MDEFSGRVSADKFGAAFSDYYRFNQRRLENAALLATDKAGKRLITDIRQEFAGANLGRLGQAFKDKSDMARGGIQRRYGENGFSASSTVYVRTKSDRTLGAIKAYTDGAQIRPVRSRWLWIATDNIPRVTGRYRMTPELWVKNGFDRKIGPLVVVRSANGYPLLVVKNVGVSAAEGRRSAKSLTKRGVPRKGQVEKQFVVAFIGIPFTARAARVDIPALTRAVLADLPAMIRNELGRI